MSKEEGDVQTDSSAEFLLASQAAGSCCMGFPGSSVIKKLRTAWETRETWVRSLGREEPLGRKWPHTPVFLPGKSSGQRNQVGYSPWGCKESDTT